MGRSSIPVLLLGCLILTGPLAHATQPPSSQTEAPAWYQTGLETLLDQLYDPDVGAIMETQEPLEHGDRWAWTGDNAKALRALARAPDHAPGETRAIGRFVASMSQGPVVFQRWVNTDEVTVIDPPPGPVEISNHLLTLRGDPEEGPLEVLIEYHDRRDRVMATIGAPSARIDGSWVTLEPDEMDLDAAADGTRATLTLTYQGPGTVVTQHLTLDASPRLERRLTVDTGQAEVTGLSMRSPDLIVRQPKLDTLPRTYKEVSLAGQAPRSVHEQGLTVFEGQALDAPWVLYLDRGTTDAFASGLGVALDAPEHLEEARATARDPDTPGLLGLEHRYVWKDSPPSAVVEDLVLLDGLVTEELHAYGEILPRIEADRFEHVDPSLIYELGEATHGLLEAPDPDGDLQARAEAWLLSYADRFERGTQTRSLAAATMAALDLAATTGEARWTELSRRFAEELRAHQITDPDHPATGAVRATTGGPPFLDATFLSMIAWQQGAEVLEAPQMQDWAEQAGQALHADGDRILLGDPPADTNHWAFKSGLALQAAGTVDDEIRWAARNHLWTVLRDVSDLSLHTSRFTGETNSETQAWGLLGLVEDRAGWKGPWILDSESQLAAVDGPSSAVTVSPAWSGTRVWVEPGWIAYAEGLPLPATSGPHGSWRYELPGTTTFWPAHTYTLGAGWQGVGFPGLERPAVADEVLSDPAIDVAWTFRPGTGWVAYLPDAPDRSGLAQIDPGEGLLVHTQEPGRLQVANRTAALPPLEDGWQLRVVPPGTQDPQDLWPGAQIQRPELPLEAAGGTSGLGPFQVAMVGHRTDAPAPGLPPALVHGQVQGPEGAGRGGTISAVQGGQTVASATVDTQGRFQLTIPADRLDLPMDLRYTAREGEPRQVAETLELTPGQAQGTLVELPGRDPGPAASPWLAGLLGLAILLSCTVALHRRIRGPRTGQDR